MNTLEHKEQSDLQAEQSVKTQNEQTAENSLTPSLSDGNETSEDNVQPIEEPTDKVVSSEIVEQETEKKVVRKRKKIEDSDEKNVENADVEQEKNDVEQENADVVQENIDKKEKKFAFMSREELVEELRELLVEPIYENIRTVAETIKIQFYKRQKQEFEAKKGEIIEAVAEKTEPIIDKVEQEFKELFAKYREIKAAANTKIEELKLNNLEKKQAILAKLEELTNSTEDLSTTIPAFRKLQAEWKKIEQVPQNMVTEIWKQYSRYQEKFYDLIKINNDLRELDFKKNYEMKTGLCEIAEKLESESDAVLAFHQLQKLHEDWREIGPVAREVREEIWTRFKDASSKINKKHQNYFENLKDKEEENLRLKTDLCEKVEQIDFAQLKTFRHWDAKSIEIVDLQNKWKEIGYAAQKQNSKIFKRFRTACDTFFKNKNNFFQTVKTELAQNIDKKRELLAKAEELKDSTEWRKTTDKFIELQKEWKQIAASPRQYTDVVWKKFAAACDYFFAQKELNFDAGKNAEEQKNLQLKEELIEKIKNYKPSGNRANDINALRDFREQFGKIGFVPIKVKGKLHDRFSEEMDKKFDEMRGAAGDGKKSSGNNSERARLYKQRDTLKNEISTYENNIGFLSSTSKKGNSLVDMMNKKVEDLKAQLEKIVEKIEQLD